MRNCFKYRIRTNQTAQQKAENWLSLCRQLYNDCLQERIITYKEKKKSISQSEQKKKLPLLKQAGWKFKGNYLIIKNIGQFRILFHRPVGGKIKTLTIRRTSTNKWFVIFSCNDVPQKLLPKTNKEIAIDMGCRAFLTDSEGNKIENPRFLKKSEIKAGK